MTMLYCEMNTESYKKARTQWPQDHKGSTDTMTTGSYKEARTQWPQDHTRKHGHYDHRIIQGSTDTMTTESYKEALTQWPLNHTRKHGHNDHWIIKETRTQHWYQGAMLAEKLWDSKEDLLQTAKLINTIKLGVCMTTRRRRRRLWRLFWWRVSKEAHTWSHQARSTPQNNPETPEKKNNSTLTSVLMMYFIRGLTADSQIQQYTVKLDRHLSTILKHRRSRKIRRLIWWRVSKENLLQSTKLSNTTKLDN